MFSFAGVFVFLSLFTLNEALHPELIEPSDAVVLHGNISAMHRSFFKSSLLLTFEIDGYCSEFTSPGFRPFHYQQFKDEFTSGMEVDFTIRKTDLGKIETCQPCELVALKSKNASFLTLAERNESSYTAKRIVAGGITGALFTAGLTCLLLGALSTKEDEPGEEMWERQTVFRRRPF